jgi:hypothetical protein
VTSEDITVLLRVLNNVVTYGILIWLVIERWRTYRTTVSDLRRRLDDAEAELRFHLDPDLRVIRSDEEDEPNGHEVSP